MGFNVKIKKNVLKDLPKLKNSNLHNRFDSLVEILRRNPFETPPPYEKLVGVPYYSRKLNVQHRLVYSVDKEKKIVIIESVWSHYER